MTLDDTLDDGEARPVVARGEGLAEGETLVDARCVVGRPVSEVVTQGDTETLGEGDGEPLAEPLELGDAAAEVGCAELDAVRHIDGDAVFEGCESLA